MKYGFESEEDFYKRFWAFVDKNPHPDGCWIWTGAYRKGGYGNFRYKIAQGKYGNLSAHRVVYEFYKGPIPPGLLVRHTCERPGYQHPKCCNPDHLLVGTCQDNANDRKVKLAG